MLIRTFVSSPAEALALSEAIPSGWLLLVGITERRLDRPALGSALTVAVALVVYALSGGDPLAIELRRGAVTGTLGVAVLASVVLGRPALLVVAEQTAKASPDRAEIQARLAEPQRRRALGILTAVIGLTFALDGATQTALALTVPTGSFPADSTAVRVVVLGSGLAIAVWTFTRQKHQRLTARR